MRRAGRRARAMFRQPGASVLGAGLFAADGRISCGRRSTGGTLGELLETRNEAFEIFQGKYRTPAEIPGERSPDCQTRSRR